VLIGVGRRGMEARRMRCNVQFTQGESKCKENLGGEVGGGEV
jgi:hypothetical protein